MTKSTEEIAAQIAGAVAAAVLAALLWPRAGRASRLVVGQ